MILASICHVSIVYGIVWSSLHCIQSTANTLTNLHGSLAVVIDIATFQRVHIYEKVSTVFIWIFVAIFLSDPNSQRTDQNSHNYSSSLKTLLVNIPFVIFFRTNRRIAEIVPNISYAVLINSVFQLIILVFLAVYFDGAEVFCKDKDICVFGWLKSDLFWFNTIINGGICGFAGTAGAQFLVKYYPMLILQNFMLLRPFISQEFGIYLGIDKVPGPLTYIGLIGIMISLVFMTIGN
jgi:hypothetical protein